MKRFLLLAALMVMGCSENYSAGERIGLVMQFSQTGLIWKSWEGHLNLTQTGMNSSVPFDFSVDNDKPADPHMIAILDSAATLGWKVKIQYHEVMGWNVAHNRGHTDHFVTNVEVLDRDMTHPLGNKMVAGSLMDNGKTVDTIYVVIVGRSSEGYKR